MFQEDLLLRMGSGVGPRADAERAEPGLATWAAGPPREAGAAGRPGSGLGPPHEVP